MRVAQIEARANALIKAKATTRAKAVAMARTIPAASRRIATETARAKGTN
jgi:hypothetical protein